MLTNIDAKEKAEEIKADYTKRYKKAMKDWKKGKEVEFEFLVQKRVTSPDMYNTMTPREVKEVLDNLEKEVLNLPMHIDGKYEWELSASYDEIYSNYFEYSYAVLCDESHVITQLAKNAWKLWLQQEARPEDYNSYTKTLNCKVVDLFMDGSIDFKTLQKLSYEGCKL